MVLFDSYIFVDWSAANTAHPANPLPDSPWFGELTPAEQLNTETYHRTRMAAVIHVRDRLLYHVGLNRRVLVGFDFPYGYPFGFARALGLPDGGAAWWNLWSELSIRLEDDDGNVNNRFQVASDLNRIVSGGGVGPFWGCPPGQATNHLTMNGPGFPFHAVVGLQLHRLRFCETRLRGVQETWGLFGTGRVGGQALTGIPCLHSLRRLQMLALCSKVWPFETLFTPTPSPNQGPFVLHAEIWPGVVEQQVQAVVALQPGMIRDQAQVRATCQWAYELDQNKRLGAFFNTPANLSALEIGRCLQEEGWILGAE